MMGISGALSFVEEDYKSEFTLKLERHLAAESNKKIRKTLQPLLDKLNK